MVQSLVINDFISLQVQPLSFLLHKPERERRGGRKRRLYTWLIYIGLYTIDKLIDLGVTSWEKAAEIRPPAPFLHCFVQCLLLQCTWLLNSWKVEHLSVVRLLFPLPPLSLCVFYKCTHAPIHTYTSLLRTFAVHSAANTSKVWQK